MYKVIATLNLDCENINSIKIKKKLLKWACKPSLFQIFVINLQN